MSLYDDLGVEPGASDEEIRQAHRKAAKRTHPDRGGDPEQFHKVQRAALVLRDPERRANYDRTGDATTDPDNRRAQAIGLVTATFNQLVLADGIDLATVNIIVEVKRRVGMGRDSVNQNKAKADADKQRLQQVLKRLKRKAGKPGTDFLVEQVNGTLREIDEALRQLDKRLEIIALAEELASDYSWHTEPVAQNYTTMQWCMRGPSTSNTTNWGE